MSNVMLGQVSFMAIRTFAGRPLAHTSLKMDENNLFIGAAGERQTEIGRVWGKGAPANE